jgi:hypothetical protein
MEILSADRFMPEALPGQAVRQKGADSESEVTESLATKLTREAEVANNQV